VSTLAIITIIGLLALAAVAMVQAKPAPFVGKKVAGAASWYGESYRGRTMANGRPFDPDKLTAASYEYAIGTKVRVTHDGAEVVVTITDRGPSAKYRAQGRVIDLSRAAFGRLANPDVGLIFVTVEELQ
jgi:rare lipoprotein A